MFEANILMLNVDTRVCIHDKNIIYLLYSDMKVNMTSSAEH